MRLVFSRRLRYEIGMTKESIENIARKQCKCDDALASQFVARFLKDKGIAT